MNNLNYIIKKRNLFEECRQHMAEHDLAIDGPITPDGNTYEYIAQPYNKPAMYMASVTLRNNQESLTCMYWGDGAEYTYDSHPLNENEQAEFNSLCDKAGLNDLLPLELEKLSVVGQKKDDPCEGFTPSLLPPPLSTYILSICETTNAHPIMITMSVMATISAILGKRVSYPYFQTLFPNLWILSITKSGQFKSTALNKGANLAWVKNKIITDQIKKLHASLRITIDPKEKKMIEEDILAISRQDVILPNKMTAEALLEHLSQGHQGVILASEFGAWLQNFDKNHNNDLKAIFTELYDVPPSYRYKTKTQGDCILERPCFSICGVSTLPWIQDNLKITDIPSGFFARFLIFTPPHQEEVPPALPAHTEKTDHEIEAEIMDVLDAISDNYVFNPLAGSAKAVFEAMHKKINDMPKAYSDRSREILDPYLKRWSPYLLKLAMIIQLFIDPTTKDISEEALWAAFAILHRAIQSTIQLFEGELGESEHERKCRIMHEALCKWAAASKRPVTWAQIITSKKLKGGSKEYEYIFQTLIDSGRVTFEKKEHRKDWIYKPVIVEVVEKS